MGELAEGVPWEWDPDDFVDTYATRVGEWVPHTRRAKSICGRKYVADMTDTEVYRAWRYLLHFNPEKRPPVFSALSDEMYSRRIDKENHSYDIWNPKTRSASSISPRTKISDMSDRTLRKAWLYLLYIDSQRRPRVFSEIVREMKLRKMDRTV